MGVISRIITFLVWNLSQSSFRLWWADGFFKAEQCAVCQLEQLGNRAPICIWIFGQHTNSCDGVTDQWVRWDGRSKLLCSQGMKEFKIQPSFGTFPYTVQVTWADCKRYLLFTLIVWCCLSMAMVWVMEISLFTEIRLGFISLVQQCYGSWIWIKTEFKINGHLYSKHSIFAEKVCQSNVSLI